MHCEQRVDAPVPWMVLEKRPMSCAQSVDVPVPKIWAATSYVQPFDVLVFQILVTILGHRGKVILQRTSGAMYFRRAQVVNALLTRCISARVSERVVGVPVHQCVQQIAVVLSVCRHKPHFAQRDRRSSVTVFLRTCAG